jgi:hypothetical protein
VKSYDGGKTWKDLAYIGEKANTLSRWCLQCFEDLCNGQEHLYEQGVAPGIRLDREGFRVAL